jgi:hypothetical protein
VNSNVSSTDFLHRFEAPTFPPVHGRTAYNFEAVVTSLFEDGAGDEPFKCLRVSADRDVWSCLCEDGKSETSWERVSKHRTWRSNEQTGRKL